MALNGLILAGGRSTRMGRDKALLNYHGKPQREHLFDLLRGCCDQVFTSCRTKQNVPPHLNPLYDVSDISGPLAGILSAFRRQHSPWLVVAVDMPHIDANALETLIAKRKDGCVATCYLNVETNSPEPLLALWEAEAGPLLEEFFRRGNQSPRTFLMRSFVNTILPLHPNLISNMNTPEDLITASQVDLR